MVETTVGDIIGSKDSNKTLDFFHEGKKVALKIQANPVKYNDYNLTLDLSVNFGGLQGKPYFVVKRNLGVDYEINWIKAYKSEVLLNYPRRNKFKVVNLSTQFLCNSDLTNKPIVIEFYDSEGNKLIGQISTTIENLVKIQVEYLGSYRPFSQENKYKVEKNNNINNANKDSKFKQYHQNTSPPKHTSNANGNGINDSNTPINVISPAYTSPIKKPKHHDEVKLDSSTPIRIEQPSDIQLKYVDNPNLLEVRLNCQYNIQYKFLDYIRGGIVISMMVALDFTSSNGDPNTAESLHSIAMQPNFYEQAMQSCCNIVAPYDDDQLFPVFGFGAQIDNNDNCHAFNLNMKKDPNVSGVKGILDCYRKFLPEAKLGGPTFFSPLISKCNMIAKNIKKHNNSDVYSVLIILTDGLICDMDDTIDDLVEASNLPLSIIIIGIGPGDSKSGFQGMVVLDSDDKDLVSSRGEKAVRDIVQFVEFNKYGGDLIKLSQQVLEEVPRQVESYYNIIGKIPGNGSNGGNDS